MHYFNECDNACIKPAPIPRKTSLAESIEAQRNITMDQCGLVNRIIGILTGGELPPPPEEGPRDLFSRLQQLESLNRLLLDGIKLIAESLGVDVC